MNAFRAVFAREFREWSVLVPASLVAGLLPFCFSLIRGFGASPRDVRDSAALVLAIMLAGLSATVLGAFVPARDLAEGRMGFYFSRPFSPWSIWSGRLLALWAISTLTWFLVFLPSTLAGGGLITILEAHAARSFLAWETLLGILAPVLMLLFLIVSCQALFISLSSRSRWLILDAALLVAFAALSFSALRRIFFTGPQNGFHRDFLACFVALLAAILLALLAAGAASAVFGRADLRVSHRALSWTLWPCLLLAATSLEGYSRWYAAPSLQSLKGAQVWEAAPRGPWVILEGEAHWRDPDFKVAYLLNSRTGNSLRVPSGTAWGAAFSDDGTRCACMKWPAGSSDTEVAAYDLTGAAPKQLKAQIPVPEGWASLALSNDGRLLAVCGERALAIHDLDGEKVLYARSERVACRIAVRFLEKGRVRVYRWVYKNLAKAEGCVELLDLDLPTRTLTETGRVEDAGLYHLQANPAGDRLLVRRFGENGGSMSLQDGNTGARLALLAEDVEGMTGAFTSGGDILAVFRKGSPKEWSLALYGPGGELKKQVSLPSSERVRIGAECAPGLFPLRLDAPETQGRERSSTMVLLDTRAMSLAAGPQGLRLNRPANFWSDNLSKAARPPDADGSRIFGGENGDLEVYDPVAGNRRVIIKGE